MRSTIVTSQLPVALWHEDLGEPTIADAILDVQDTSPVRDCLANSIPVTTDLVVLD